MKSVTYGLSDFIACDLPLLKVQTIRYHSPPPQQCPSWRSWTWMASGNMALKTGLNATMGVMVLLFGHAPH
jgi:hypothetical protein